MTLKIFQVVNTGGKYLNKQIFIINGSGEVGKDTFVKYVSDELNDIMKRFHTVNNFSSVDKVKEIAREIGWNGEKTEKDRKFLSDLKALTNNYCDMPFQSLENKVLEFNRSDENILLFLHIREPEEITRAVLRFNAKTILITRSSIHKITSNPSDKNVFNYNYDYVIENNGTLYDLKDKAKKFIKNLEE